MQEIGWSVEAKLLYQIKQLTKALSGRTYIAVFPNLASFPNPGITGTLYVDESTGDIYVWNGTSYVLLSSGITALNGLIAAAQTFATGTAGTDFNISSVGTTHTFNFPTASATNRGLLSSADWTTFNNKQNTLSLTTTGTSGAATLVGSTLNIPQYQAALTNPITGTGTVNYVPKFTAAGTIGNSQIFDNGTNIGIGTTSPVTKLDIVSSASTVVRTKGGTGSAQGSAYYVQLAGSANTLAAFGDRANMFGGTVDQAASVFTGSNIPLTFDVNTAERMRLTAAGRLLVGTTTDAGDYNLQVNGNQYVNGNSQVTNDKFFRGTNTGGSALNLIGIGGDNTLYIGDLGVSQTLRLVNSSGSININTSGNVGINTTNQTERLDVNGRIRVRTIDTNASPAHYLTSDANGVIQRSTYGPTGGSGTLNFVAKWTPDGVNLGNSLIQDNGTDVGIGSNSAGARLEILRTATGGALNNTTGSVFGSLHGSGGGPSAYGFAIRHNGSAFAGISGSNFVTQLISSTTNANAFEMYTTGSSPVVFGTNAVERMRLTSAGDLGIGSSSPLERLHIQGAVDAGEVKLKIHNNFGTLNTTSSIAFTTSTTASFENAKISAIRTGGAGDPQAALAFSTSTSGGTLTERMRITTAGNVYITSGNFYGVTTETNNNHGILYSSAIDGLESRGFAGFRWNTGTSGATERMRLASNGNLLIGTTTDTGERIIVSGNASFGSDAWYKILSTGGGNGRFTITNTASFDFGGAFLFRNANATTEYARITSSGNVGIGTASPAHKLVVSNAGAEGFEFVTAGSPNVNILQSYTRATNQFISLVTRSSIFRVQIGTNDALYIDESSRVGIGTTAPQRLLHIQSANGTASQIQLGQTSQRDYYIGIPASQTYFDFFDASAGASRMVISSAGNVGIGTTSPSARFEVAGGASYINQDNLLAWNVAGSTTLRAYIIGTSGNELQFWNRQGGINTQAITLSGTGNVGIGFTNPTSSANYTSLAIGGTSGSELYMYAGSDLEGYYTADVNGISIRVRTATNRIFRVFTATAERFRVNQNGNFLIGTTTDDGNRFQVAGTMINSTSAYFAISSGNVGIRQTIFGTSAVGTLAIGNGTAPTTSPADAFQLYSADVVAGNAAPHFRTENGAVVKVYQETTGVAAATRVGGGGTTVTDTDTFDGYTIAQVVRALRNQGLLA